MNNVPVFPRDADSAAVVSASASARAETVRHGWRVLAIPSAAELRKLPIGQTMKPAYFECIVRQMEMLQVGNSRTSPALTTISSSPPAAHRCASAIS